MWNRNLVTVAINIALQLSSCSEGESTRSGRELTTRSDKANSMQKNAIAVKGDGNSDSLQSNDPSFIAEAIKRASTTDPANKTLSQSSRSTPGFWQFPVVPCIGANNNVYTAVSDGSRFYVGGTFHLIGPCTGSGVPLSTSTGKLAVPVERFAKVTGKVFASLPDGSGGWYISGGINAIGGVPASGLAHILPDGSNDSKWNFIFSGGAPESMALSGKTLYLGGSFVGVNNIARNNAAAIDTSTAQVLSWNPSPNGEVLSLALSGSTVFAGGTFTSIGGQNRKYFAALDAASGVALDNWNHDFSDYVYSLTAANSKLYVGGKFIKVDGQQRNSLASFDLTSGAIQSWNPSVTVANWALHPNVLSIIISGNVVYIGGSFTNVGSSPHFNIAAIDIASGIALSNWNPSVNNEIDALAISGNSLYIGGFFNSINGQERSYIGAVSVATGELLDWNPNSDGAIKTLSQDGSSVYAGGEQKLMNGQVRNCLAAFDSESGQLLDWDPKVNKGIYCGINLYSTSYVMALAISGNTLYLGGLFSNVNGEGRFNLAAVDLDSAALRAWNPTTDGVVRALAIKENAIFVGGQFNSIAGVNRSCLASVDLNTGMPNEFSANANGMIYTLLQSGNTLYAGGGFTTINGHVRNHAAAINTQTSELTSWDPNLGYNVYSLAALGSDVFVGGGFQTIGGRPIKYLAATDSATGAFVDRGLKYNWITFGVSSLMVSGPSIFLGLNAAAIFDSSTGKTTYGFAGDMRGLPSVMAKSKTTVFLNNVRSLSLDFEVGGAAFDITTGAPRW